MADDAGTTTSASPYAQPGEHPRLDWHLENWAKWMHINSDAAELDTHIVSFWASGSSDFDTMADVGELDHAVFVNARINDLPAHERISVHHFHMGTAIWRTNREPIQEIYQRARLKISAGLIRDGRT